MDAAEFLRARLDEDEAIARATAQGTLPAGMHWSMPDPDSGRIEDEHGLVVVYDEGAPTVLEASHIARHDPARVLRDVEAKRRILKEVVELIDDMDARIESEWGSGRYRATGESDLLLKLLAMPYSDHPDYDPAWAGAGTGGCEPPVP